MTENPSIEQLKMLALIDEIEARASATTEGLWYRECSDVVAMYPDPRDADSGFGEPRNLRIVRGPDHLDEKDRQGIANAEFISHCKVDVPFLTAIIRRQAEQLANVRSLTAEIGASDNFINAVISRGLRRALGDEPEVFFDEDEDDEDDTAAYSSQSSS